MVDEFLATFLRVLKYLFFNLGQHRVMRNNITNCVCFRGGKK